MSLRDLYGFSGYDRETVDDRHLLACPGCYVCSEALDRAVERDYRRRPHPRDDAADRAHDARVDAALGL